MKRVAVLYFSGAGSTKKVADLIRCSIEDCCIAELHAVEQLGSCSLQGYDGLVIGTPVYHAAPAKLVMDYFSGVPALPRQMPAFLYNTRATWSCNTNRILAKHLLRCNIITVMDREYRSPASDGSLLVPFVQRFFAFEQQLRAKVERDSRLFVNRMNAPAGGYIPRFRISSIINAPNKLAGQLITFTIHTHRDKCTKCGNCIENCPRRAMGRDAKGYARFIRSKCENCYRCIHHCPAKALSLSKHRAPSKLLGPAIEG